MSLLGLNDDADNKMFIRYMPSLNGWFINKEDEVALKHFLLDVGSIKTGWGKIALGESPVWVWDDAIGHRALRPGEGEEERLAYKRGFSVDMFIKDSGLRTWSTTTTGSNIGFEKLYTELHAQMGANSGKYAVIEYTGSEAIKVGKGNTRVPELKLLKWVESDEFETNQPNGVFEEPVVAPVIQEMKSEEIPF